MEELIEVIVEVLYILFCVKSIRQIWVSGYLTNDNYNIDFYRNCEFEYRRMTFITSL